LNQHLKEKDVLRILRNLCVEEENQIELKNQNILKNLVELLMEESSEEILIFQVVGNSILNCKENQIYLKEMKFYNFTLKRMQSSKRVLLSIISMILFNSREVFNFQNDFDSLDFLLDNLYNKKKESDSTTKWMYQKEIIHLFSCFIFEKLENLEIYFQHLKEENQHQRIMNLFEIMDGYITNTPDDEILDDSKVQLFYQFCLDALQLFFKTEKMKFIEFETLFVTLEFLSNLSIFKIKKETLSDNIISILFKMLKFSENKIEPPGDDENLNLNIFKSTNLYVELLDDDNTFMYYGYKSNLIRIFGNLCHENEENQNLFRNENLIPIVLSHCSIEDDNPCKLNYFNTKTLKNGLFSVFET
jgi:hypothetical protein